MYDFLKNTEYYADFIFILVFIHEVSKGRQIRIILTLFNFSDSGLVHSFRQYVTQYLIDTCPDSKGNVSWTFRIL